MEDASAIDDEREKKYNGGNGGAAKEASQEKGYTLPEYAFTVECGGATSEESGQIDVMGWIKFQLKEDESDRIMSNMPIRIAKEDGTFIRCKSDENGYVYLKDLPYGRYSIEMDND